MLDPVAYINEPRWHTMSLGLDRIRELLARLDNPQNQLKFVHVAGTNGKGSTCACCASILQAAGYKVGLFTSPYIERFEERIQINSTSISYDDLTQVTLKVRDAAEAMDDHPTEFELMTAVAFLHFVQQGCDIVVAEVGLGGRLDSTNIIDTVEVSLIAPISLDHCALLGNTIAEIAQEKAGIIKPHIPVVSAEQAPEAYEVLRAQAQTMEAPFHCVDISALQGTNDNFSYKSYQHLELSLQGSYQLHNAALAIEACEVLMHKGWQISDEAIRQGLLQAQWPGRFEVLHHKPDVIVDGAHNVQAAQQLVQELEQRYPLRRILFCLGVMADKDYQDMLNLLAPMAKAFICYAPRMARALSAQRLASSACAALAQLDEDTALGCMVVSAESPEDAIRQAYDLATEYDVVCCCGSLYGIGDIKKAFYQLDQLDQLDD